MFYGREKKAMGDRRVYKYVRAVLCCSFVLIFLAYVSELESPGGLVGGPRAYRDQFRGFEYPRVHTRRDFFLHKKIINGKRESVS